ncbi:hypothetical protein CC1G_09588 [Coprinopsis cinerea okayama7|uniref:FHA domain-containing protein n=1 Tax=Coprinopsis cinerea (strain Okayama-7 / 130 / ATCC MYA-4618 / FGSC 9003) TaxID=240176 RepID=A8P9A0_COPC7|nr:hypothetical protein CC1G_09588 [Coprinopsis cinerea okayama7\|eukprot:XP_001839733.1 hypothetical protein CC1G_09588 [Coprinopsis cinerea okayama7\
MSFGATVTLSPHAGTFPFSAKQLLIIESKPITLGAASSSLSLNDTESRRPLPSNGWFKSLQPKDDTTVDILPLSLSERHAQLRSDGKKVYIRDLDTPFGTFLNGTRLTQEVELKSGDVIALGSPIPRSSKTPKNITDDHLKCVMAQVTISY